MTEDRFQALEKSVTRIETAVCGDEQMGQPGMIKDVAEIKEWRRKLSLRMAFVSGGFVSVWEGLKFVADWLRPHDR